ncbi:electron transporter [Flavobacterium sp. Sd200]|uniref:RnfABCDGE type electron transport complex subunit D n=1 Tax=Flavobacterium sp. Sd200 TaxID=2692211 RepID=UPI00136C89E6|nr:RnfABCDGE type electron transport complex subunit D [Flavobacterium sp. Sd200]MXN90475.1 electron transporter [Flavobacterium sp. Sd200]
MNLNPYIKPKYNSTLSVMTDVIIALFPLVAIAYFAYGMQALLIIGTGVGTALFTDFIFSVILIKKWNAIFDGSAIITGLLLSFTLSPVTPLYVVAFGAFTAILFGKLLWGGLGKNRFNPALVGREFMTVFFPVMTSASIWATKSFIKIKETDVFITNGSFFNEYSAGLLYKTTGAMGEYSVAAIALGGLYLLVRKRISWHIPFGLLLVFSICFWLINDGDDLKYSAGGVLLGALFMATDMPSSPNSPNGKLYYGAMIGLCAFFFILAGVRFEYMSFSILLLNGFCFKINEIFMPRVWGHKTDFKSFAEKIFLLTLLILGGVMALLSAHYYGLIHYLVYAYIIYMIFKFNFSFSNKISNPI